MKLKGLHRLYTLTRGDWILLFRSAATLLACAVVLKTRGFKKTLDRTGPAAPSTGRRLSNTEQDLVRASTIAVNRAARLTRIGTCLSKSLALQKLLISRDIDTELRIGVRKQPGGLAAHAWLERAGDPVDGTTSGETFDTAFFPGRAAGPVCQPD